MWSTEIEQEIKESLYDPKQKKGKGKLTITGKKPALKRLKKHLEKEHPSTKGKMKVNDPAPKKSKREVLLKIDGWESKYSSGDKWDKYPMKLIIERDIDRTRGNDMTFITLDRIYPNSKDVSRILSYGHLTQFTTFKTYRQQVEKGYQIDLQINTSRFQNILNLVISFVPQGQDMYAVYFYENNEREVAYFETNEEGYLQLEKMQKKHAELFYDPAPKRCEPGINAALARKGIEPDTVDVSALIDSDLSCDENKKNVLAVVGARTTDKYSEYARQARQHYGGQGKLAVARPDVRAAAFARMREAGELRGYDPKVVSVRENFPSRFAAKQRQSELEFSGGLVRDEIIKDETDPKHPLFVVEWIPDDKLQYEGFIQITPQKRTEKEQKAKAQQGKKLRGQQTLTSAVSTSRRLSEFGFDPKKKYKDPEYVLKYIKADNEVRSIKKELTDFNKEAKKGDSGIISRLRRGREIGIRQRLKDAINFRDVTLPIYYRMETGKLPYDPKKPSGWFDAMVRGIKRSSDVRNPWAIVKRIWQGLSIEKKTDILRREAAGERFNYDLPLPDDRDTKGIGTLRMVKPFKLAEAQVNVSAKDMAAVKKSGIFKPMAREDGSTCMVARCKSKTPVNIFVDELR